MARPNLQITTLHLEAATSSVGSGRRGSDAFSAIPQVQARHRLRLLGHGQMQVAFSGPAPNLRQPVFRRHRPGPIGNLQVRDQTRSYHVPGGSDKLGRAMVGLGSGKTTGGPWS